LAEEMHRLWRTGQTPPAVYGPKCDQCSLHDLCMPRTTKRDAAGYLDRMLDDLTEDAREP